MSQVYRSGLADAEISGALKAMPDYIFYNETVPNNTNVASSMFSFGKLQGMEELVVNVRDDVVLQDTKSLTLTLEIYTDKDDLVADSTVTLYTVTASGETTLATGTELVRYNPPSSQSTLFCKLRFASTDTGQAGEIDAFIEHVAR